MLNATISATGASKILAFSKLEKLEHLFGKVVFFGSKFITFMGLFSPEQSWHGSTLVMNLLPSLVTHLSPNLVTYLMKNLSPNFMTINSSLNMVTILSPNLDGHQMSPNLVINLVTNLAFFLLAKWQWATIGCHTLITLQFDKTMYHWGYFVAKFRRITVHSIHIL